MTTDDLRRMDDRRFNDLDRKISSVAADVAKIRELLITEPEASPLGRSLLRKSIENRAMIDQLNRDFVEFKKEEFQPLDDWWNQSRGAWKVVLGLATILSMIGAFFGIVSYFGA